jgi:hypothetical protein
MFLALWPASSPMFCELQTLACTVGATIKKVARQSDRLPNAAYRNLADQ